tara:strand:- start:1137 stop:1697 length:561 start_codon:yes stop_codon:yes gene_type:complete
MTEIELFKTVVTKQKLKQNLSYLTKLSLDIEKEHSRTEFKSNVGGFQSKKLDPTLISELVKDILYYGNIFFKNFNYEKELELLNIWLNINRHKDSNAAHVHPFSKVSGVFYIKVPENSGNLVFINPQPIECYLDDADLTESNRFNSSIFEIQGEENTLYLFPSWFRHRVNMNLSKEERISISFNLG